MDEDPLASLCPECYYAFIGIDAAAESLTALGLNLHPSPISSTLTHDLMVDGNRFEKIGQIHNAELDYMLNFQKNGGNIDWRDKSIRDVFIEKAVAGIDTTENAKNELSNQLKKALSEKSKIDFLQSKSPALSVKKVSPNTVTVLTTPPKISPIYTYMRQFDEHFRSERTKNIKANISFINSEIVTIMNNSDEKKIKDLKLAYVTTYKYSYYFWHNYKA